MVNQNVKNTLGKSQDTKIKIWENTETNKGTQRGLLKTSKWNKGHYKKRDTWIKEDSTNYKWSLTKIRKTSEERIKQKSCK
jgi:hypothetical protein